MAERTGRHEPAVAIGAAWRPGPSMLGAEIAATQALAGAKVTLAATDSAAGHGGDLRNMTVSL